MRAVISQENFCCKFFSLIQFSSLTSTLTSYFIAALAFDFIKKSFFVQKVQSSKVTLCFWLPCYLVASSQNVKTRKWVFTFCDDTTR